ncbi:protein similar-like isoform X2 [Anopheles darlingi]|uniref:protein similar-like isoform X2 n=1 Tax=Anopheles darlingi TaxID=43151 RepID=UPI0021003253|nr:protein similar-like isoform X2 [Anopheles darlingi]XP_049535597.1 protein similar-like isoform X2 [Anopheles darlingi]
MTKTASPTTKAMDSAGKKAVKPVKEKRRNNEKRKEKSRDAARCRRSRETEIFQDLASLLPMAQEEVDHLDKASVMRLSIAYLRARNMLELYDFPQKNEKMEIKQDEDVSMEATTADVDRKLDLKALGLEPEMVPLQALDGFLLVLSVDGDVTYVSENVSDYLGIAQIDIMGQPIWEYSHQCDHDELREALNGRHHSPSELLNGVANSECRPLENRDFFLRLKCTLTSRGRSVNIRSASYKVLHVTGHIACKDKEGQRQLVSIARPLPHPANIEVPLGSSTFLSKHTLGMKFSYVDDKMLSLLGYEPSDLLGKSMFECHHASDADHLMGTFKHVISKGQSETCRYRFLAKMGGYAWVVTQATVIYDKQKPHSIVCVNYVISGVENKDEILSCAQLEAREQQQQLSVEAEQCSTSGSVCTSASAIEPHPRNSVPALASAAPALPADIAIVKVPAEETVTIRSENVPEVARVVIGSGGGVGGAFAVCYTRKNSAEKEVATAAGAAAAANQRILREQNSVSGVVGGGGDCGAAIGLQKASTPATNIGKGPVCVTASIFTSLEPKAATTAAAAAAATCKQPITPAPPAGIAPGSAPLLQSVTAKLFVTLPPTTNGGAVTATGNKPQHATEKIFAPRTEDMNKGFLMFSEEEPGLTMLKDEPDDLTHLAPTAGDACIPLEESGTFFNEIFEDFIIPESYNLLQDELCSLDSQDEPRLDGTSMGVQSPSIPTGGCSMVNSIGDSLVMPSLDSSTVTNHESATAALTTRMSLGHTQQHQQQQQQQQQQPAAAHNLSAAGPGSGTATCPPTSSPTSMASFSCSSSSLSSVPSSPSGSFVSSSSSSSLSNPNSPSCTSGLGSSASSTVSNVDTSGHSTIGHSQGTTSNDPFINYRDETNEVSPSPHLLSPGISKSPESSSLPSLCSPNGSLPEDELAFMSLNMDELDLSMRAPYISMSEVDDLPLLTSDDLLWGATGTSLESGTQGATLGSAFGLSGKFFIKDEFTAIGHGNTSTTNSTSNSGGAPSHQNGSSSSAAAATAPTALLLGKEHSLITDVTIGAGSSVRATNACGDNTLNNGNNDDSKSTLTSAAASIESSLAALLCGGNVISIQTDTSEQQQQTNGNNQILIAHSVPRSINNNTTTTTSTSHQQSHQRQHNQQQQQQQLIVNAQQPDGSGSSATKRIKLTEQESLQQSLLVIPANVKLCDTWKFEDLLQLNDSDGTLSNHVAPAKAIPQQVAGSFAKATTKKVPSGTTVNGNNKRTLNGANEAGATEPQVCKRLRPSSSSTSAPQLLQQLMAPSPLPQKLKSKSKQAQDGSGGARWPNGTANGGVGGLLQEQSSNSVLMNLLVSGCDDAIPLTPPEQLIDDTVQRNAMATDIPSANDDDNNLATLLMNLGEDDDTGVLFSSTNPLIGGQAPLNDAIVRPLTIQTGNVGIATGGTGVAAGGGLHPPQKRGTRAATDEFMMTVSPSLLTPTDMEIWRAIQAGQLDPKKLTLASYGGYIGGGGGCGGPGAGNGGNMACGHISPSMTSTPTAQLSAELLGDTSEGNLLAALDPGLNLPLELELSRPDHRETNGFGCFRTIAAQDALQHGLK